MDNELEINGKRFAITGDVELEYYSPFIDGEELKIEGESINPRGNYTMQFTLQGNAELAAVLNNPQLLQRRDRVLTINGVVLRSRGIRIDAGHIDIYRIPQNLNHRTWKVDVHFYSEDKTFADVVADAKVQDLQLHGRLIVRGDDVTYWLNMVHDAYGVDFRTNRVGPGFSLGDGELYVTREGLNIWRWIYDNIDGALLQDTHVMANLINLGVEPWDVGGSGYTDQPCLGWFVFPSYYGDYDTAADDSLQGMLNHYSSSQMQGYKAEVQTGGPEEWVKYTPLRNQVVPMYYYHKVLRACFEEYGYTLEGELLQDADFLKLILPNTYSILRESVLGIENLFGEIPEVSYVAYSENITFIEPKNHLPDMTVLEFIRDCMLRFNVFFKIKGTHAVMVGNGIDKPTAVYNEIDPEVVAETKDSSGVTVKYKFDTGDTSYNNQNNYKVPFKLGTYETESLDISGLANGERFIDKPKNSIDRKDTTLTSPYIAVEVNNLVPYSSGTGKTFESELTPVEMGERPYYPDNDPDSDSALNTYLPVYGHNPTIRTVAVTLLKWKIFITAGDDSDTYTFIEAGDNELLEGGSEKKIALYHGLQQTLQSAEEGFSYPYMAFHNYAPLTDGTGTKLGNWHLGWNGEEGLIKTFWRDWVKVFTGFKVTYLIPLTWQQLRQHDWQRSDIVRGSKVYISSIKFKLPALFRGLRAIVETFEL